MPRINTIQVRRDTASNWTSANPVLLLGEVGYETDTRKSKIGDGSTAWTSLSYIYGEDGSFSDLSVSSGGFFDFYNTVDQTTNYERVRHYWSSSIYRIASQIGGTGTFRRDIRLSSGEDSASASNYTVSFSSSVAKHLIEWATASVGAAGLRAAGTFSAASGTNVGLLIAPTINASGTHGYTALLINATENTVGSGSRLLADFQTGSTSKVVIDDTGRMGLLTQVPTHTLTLASAATGIASYNTTDQTTNYERVRMYWSGITYVIDSELGGSGTFRRDISLRSGSDSAYTASWGSASAKHNFSWLTAAAGAAGVRLNGSFTSSSGTNYALSISPIIAGSGTQGYTAALVNVTETSTGSGPKLLADWQVGGVSKASITNAGDILANNLSGTNTGDQTATTVSNTPAGNIAATTVQAALNELDTEKAIDTTVVHLASAETITGQKSLSSTSSGLLFYNTADQTTNYERVHAYYSSNIFNIVGELGGTGVFRDVRVGATTSLATTYSIGNTKVSTQIGSTGSTSNLIVNAGTLTASSGVQPFNTTTPTVSQSGTGGYTAQLINVTESSTGSGAKLLQDLQVGGVSKYKVANDGLVTASNRITSVTDPTSAQDAATKNYVDTQITSGIKILSTTTGIDAKSVATTNLYTVPTGKTAIITGAVVRCTAASAITNGPTLGIGVAAGEDDMFASTNVAALTSTTKIFGFQTMGMSVSAAAASVIKAGIDTAATGTSQTIAIDLMGYLL